MLISCRWFRSENYLCLFERTDRGGNRFHTINAIFETKEISGNNNISTGGEFFRGSFGITDSSANDHRNFNRYGAAFNRGETFSGVDFETGLRAVQQLEKLVPPGATLSQLALRWILEFPAVTCAIPGGKRPAQVLENIAASDLAPLSGATLKKIDTLYAKQIRPLVQHYW